MTEPGEPRRKRHKPSRAELNIGRRPALMVGGVAILATGAAIAAGPKIIDYLHNLQLESEADTFRKTIPTLPEYDLPPTFEQEGWGELFQVPDYTHIDQSERLKLAEKSARDMMEDLELRMAGSSYFPFAHTITYLREYHQVDKPGGLEVVLDVFPPDPGIGDTIFATHVFLDANEQLRARIAINVGLFSAGAPEEVRSFLTRGVLALSLAHEKAHHVLAMEMFNHWLSKGLNPHEAIEKVMYDNLQEPYAYWEQAKMTKPLIHTAVAQHMPDSFIADVKLFTEINEVNGKWYQSRWATHINRQLTLPTSNRPNVPLIKANTTLGPRIGNAKIFSNFGRKI